MFAAFRANIDPKAWAKGELKWIVPLDELLAETIIGLCDVVRTTYYDMNSDPAMVGKKPSAYRSCYQVVLLRLARTGMLAA